MQDTELKEILIKVRNNDDGAFEQLTKRYMPLINSVASSFNASAAAAGSEDIFNDLFQDLTLALYKAAMTFDISQDAVTFGLYAKTCMHNRAVSALRKVKSAVSRESRVKDKLKREHTMESCFSALQLAEKEDLTSRIAPYLSAFELDVLRLYLDGLHAAEIAGATGKNVKAVNNAIYRCKVKIRKIYNVQ